MKRIFIVALLLTIGYSAFSQRPAPTYRGEGNSDNDNTTTGFKKENLFLGGSLGLGFASGQFAVGANPEIGYSLTPWLDAGIVANVNYNSISAEYNGGIGQHTFNYGAGVFGRIYPVRFLFVQVQPEQNWVSYSFQSGSGIPSYTTNAFSLIGGIGYTQRIVGQSSYFLMLGMDFLRNPGSPYLDYTNAPVPIIRAGFDFYLHPGR